MKTLSHKQLHGRQFGSALLNVEGLKKWQNAQGITIDPPPEGDFIQVELMLVEIERARFDALTDEEATAIVKANPGLVSNYVDGLRTSGLDDETVQALTGDDLSARWLCSADAHRQWRELIAKAVQSGALVLLDCNSKLPLPKAPQRQLSDSNGKYESSERKTKTWQDHAREIADELFDHDSNANPQVRDSLQGYAERAMKRMGELKIHGPRGPITNANTVLRDALQGDKWWKKKKK